MSEKFPNERELRKCLRFLAKQRFSKQLMGKTVMIEPVIPDKHRVLLNTCYIRGWVEVIRLPIETLPVPLDGVFETQNASSLIGDCLYRITDSGWNALHRPWRIAFLSLTVSVMALCVSLSIFLMNYHIYYKGK